MGEDENFGIWLKKINFLDPLLNTSLYFTFKTLTEDLKVEMSDYFPNGENLLYICWFCMNFIIKEILI